VKPFEEFNLSEKADVDRLAQELGANFADTFAPLVVLMSEEHRCAFFGYLLGAPLGAMSAAIGLERARQVLEVLVEAAARVEEQKRRALH
jgi:hypothetical protein